MILPSTEITVEYDCHIRPSVKGAYRMTLLAAFAVVLPQLLTEFLENILLGYARQVMAWPRKLCAYDHCDNGRDFIWKALAESKEGPWQSPRKVLGRVQGKPEGSAVPDSDHLHLGGPASVAGSVLGVQASVLPDSEALRDERQERIPKAVYRKPGLVGALASYRVGAKIVSTFGGTIDKMTIWKAV